MADPQTPAPDVDAFMGRYGAAPQPQTNATAGQSPVDSFMSRYAHNALISDKPNPADFSSMTTEDIGKSLVSAGSNPLATAFGVGAVESFGKQPIGGWDEELTKALTDAGIYDDVKKGQATLLGSFYNAVVRPPLSAITNLAETAFRGLGAVTMGVGAAGAYAVGKYGEPILGKESSLEAGRTVMGLAESGAGLLGSPFHFGVPEGKGAPVRAPAVPSDIAAARDLGVIGGTDAEYFGNQSPDFRAETDKVLAQSPPTGALTQTAPIQDAHTVARQMAPELFNEYDALQQQHATLFDHVQELGNQRAQSDAATAAQARIDEILGKVNGVESRLTKAAAGRLADARDALDTALRTETPEMARVRQDMMATDFRMRELAPQVSQAYRDATAKVGSPEAAPISATQETTQAPITKVSDGIVGGETLFGWQRVANSEHFDPEKGIPLGAVTDEERQQLSDAGLLNEHGNLTYSGLHDLFEERDRRAAQGKSTTQITPEGEAFKAAREKQQTNNIAPTVVQKLTEAGRPQEEANALGALVQAHYEARAARFGGTKGTAQELFDREAPQVVGESENAPATAGVEYAQSSAPTFTKEEAAAAINKAIEANYQSRLADVKARYMLGTPEYDAALQRARTAAEEWINQPEGREYLANDEFAKSHPDFARELQDYFSRSYERVAEEQPFHANVNRIASVTYEQARRGKITFAPERNIISLFRTADASTFIHETGHAWLEELMSDAADAQAPAELRADAATVRDWLGAEEGKNLTRAQHEKFARGFERYMMEGVAPSKPLAKVFAQFKEWLTTIYRTASRLRSPITDDIRGVFDRMLAEKPERTVYAPEREATPNIAERAEQSAENTPAVLADKEQQTIRAEADAYAAANVPEIANELADAGLGERPNIAANQTESGVPNGRGAAGQSIAGATERGAAAGTVGPSRGEIAPEVTGGGSGAGQPPSGGGEIPPNGGRYFDKAGNIRLDNIAASDDVKAALREFALESVDFTAERRGVVTDYDVEQLVQSLGLDGSDLNIEKLRQMSVDDGIPLAARIRGGRRMMVQAVQEMVNFAKSMGETDADVVRYANLRAKAIMIARTVAGVTAEWGRAGRAFRSVEGFEQAREIVELFQNETGKSIKQLRREAKALATMDTQARAAKFVKDSTKPDFWDWFTEYIVNDYISGLATHSTYVVGNTVSAILKAIPETAAEAAIGAFRQHVLGQQGPRAYFGEIGAQLRALNETGNPYLTARKLEKIVRGAKNWDEAKGQIYALLRGSRDGVMAAARAAIEGATVALPGEEAVEGMSAIVSPRNAIPNPVIAGHTVPIGTVIRLPSRMVAMIHSYFRAVGYEQQIARLSYRTATEEGLSGAEFDKRVAQLRDSPTKEMMEESAAGATEQTLMGAGGDFTQALSRLVNTRISGVPALKIIDPFVKVVGNVLELGLVQRTPLGVLDPEVRANLFGRNGPRAQDTQLARVAVGTALGLVGFGMALERHQNGNGPSDPRQAALYRRVNGPPNATRIGDWWYDFHRLGFAALPYMLGANLYDTAHLISDKDFGDAMSQIAFTISHTLIDESGLRGPSDLIHAIDDPHGYGVRYVRSELPALTVPYSVGVGQMARAIDPYQRRVAGMLDAFRSKVPWWSEQNFPLRDWTGEPIPSREALGIDGLSAIYEERARNDPVEQAMLRLGIYPALPPKKIRGVELSEQQYDDYARMAGKFAYQSLRLVVTPGFNRLPPDRQEQLIKSVLKQSRQYAEARVLSMDEAQSRALGTPSIIQRATAAKRAAIYGQPVAQ